MTEDKIPIAAPVASTAGRNMALPPAVRAGGASAPQTKKLLGTYTKLVDYVQCDGVNVIAGNCVGGSSEARHFASLDAMEYLQAGARRTTREILEAFAALAAGRALPGAPGLPRPLCHS